MRSMKSGKKSTKARPVCDGCGKGIYGCIKLLWNDRTETASTYCESCRDKVIVKKAFGNNEAD